MNKDRKTKIGLRESTKLFVESMAEVYCKESDTKNGILMVVSENGGVSSALVGNGAILANDLANVMLKDKDFDSIVNTAFVAIHGKKFYELIKKKIQNGEELPEFNS